MEGGRMFESAFAALPRARLIGAQCVDVCRARGESLASNPHVVSCARSMPQLSGLSHPRSSPLTCSCVAILPAALRASPLPLPRLGSTSGDMAFRYGTAVREKHREDVSSFVPSKGLQP
eukprot:6071775-Prymnesium_polylepis.1